MIPHASWLRTAFALLSLAVLVFLGRHHLPDLKVIARATWWEIGGISLLFLTNHLGLAVLWSWMLRCQSRPFSLPDSFFLMFLRTYLNLLVPWAGGGMAGAFLKRRLGLAYSTYVHILWEINWINISIVFGAGAVALALQRPDLHGAGALTAVFATLAGCALCLAYLVRIPGIDNFLPARPTRWLKQRTGPAAARIPATPLIASSVLLFLVRAGRTWLLFVAVGNPVSMVEAILLTGLAELSVAINLTPTGLGIREAVISLGAGLLGHDPGVGLAASVLDRLIFTAWTVAFGQIAIWKLHWHDDRTHKADTTN